MKQIEFEDLPQLSIYRYENFFNIYTDKNGERFYNIIKSINLFPANSMAVEDNYYSKPHDTWYSISYNYYKTPDLWWLVCTYNQIFNASKKIESGTLLKLLKPQHVGYVLQELNQQINR